MGKKVSEVIDNLKRQVIDAEVEIEFNRRKYKGKQERDVKKIPLWVGILALIISRRVYLLVFSANLENAPRYAHLRWATIFVEKTHRLFDAILNYSDIDASLMELFEVYQSQALDPNVNQKRLMDEWRT
ncbi:MAG: hypothetical protein EF812_04965 [Methanosarcinales archaeon]|nr:MAG: hypothetical protein EF812_04965 [Methanosarcinales archaeon]